MSSTAETHIVENQPPLQGPQNLFTTDRALVDSVNREGAADYVQDLTAFGAKAGSAEMMQAGDQANRFKPELYTHDQYGNRIDEIRFHPAWHDLMSASLENGLHADHWANPGKGAHVARAAKFYMMSQTEAGHGCPVTMTSASVPALRNQPDIAERYIPKILSRGYDHRNLPIEQKEHITIGMAMTEKQGGSDVRRNTTRAVPLGPEGPGQEYELTGHKYFVSATMSDAFLVLAQAPGGLSCFFLPRWRPDGTKNPLHIMRLKNKMGNVSNASSETELRGAWALMVGEEGRGVRTIIDMVSMTRFDCMIGSTSGMRQAVVQALHQTRHRAAFGALLKDQPLMQNVLADLVIEQEAAMAMTMRMGRALDNVAAGENAEQLLVRLCTSVGKYWICKRAPEHAYEAMECLGGSGVMEDSIMPRLFRESPINAIWEGSGNVQALDMLRALKTSPDSLEIFFGEMAGAKGLNSHFDQALGQLQASFSNMEDAQYRARHLIGQMALVWSASLLLQNGNEKIADAWCAGRLDPQARGLVYGNLPQGLDCAAIIDRAMPA